MSRRATVKSAVDKAFAAIGDLVVSATLSKKTVSGYNFATGVPVSVATSKSVKVFLESTTKPSNGTPSAKAMMKSGVSVGSYDTLTIGTDVYSITEVTDDSFVITLSLTKGGC